MTVWKRASLALTCISLAALVVAGCGSDDDGSAGSSAGASSSESASVRVAYVPAVSSLPLMIADAKGYFEDERLDVELTPSQNLATFAPGLGRQYDIVFATPADLIVAASRGLDIAGFAGLSLETEKHPVLATIATKGSGVTELSQLQGKTIGVPTLAGTLYTALVHQIETAGVDPGSVKFQEVAFPNQLDQMAAGRLDAALSTEPFVGQLQAEGHVPLGSPYLAVDSPAALSTLWAASPGWVRENEDVVARWNAALEQAMELLETDPAEARSVLQESIGLPPEVAKRVKLPEYSLDLTVEQLTPWIRVLTDDGTLPGGAPEASSLVVTGK